MVPGSRVQDADGPGVYWWRVGTSFAQWTPPRGSPPGQGGKEILAGAPVGDVPAIMQLMFQQSKISLVVPQIQFQSVGHSSLVRTVQNCAADHGDLTGPDAPRCCAMTGAWVRNAWFDSGYISCVSSRTASWTNSSHFLREGGTLDPQVDSCFFPANMAEEGSGRARRLHGSGMQSTCFAPRAVFPMIAARSACTR